MKVEEGKGDRGGNQRHAELTGQKCSCLFIGHRGEGVLLELQRQIGKCYDQHFQVQMSLSSYWRQNCDQMFSLLQQGNPKSLRCFFDTDL